METTMLSPPSSKKRRCCDTELRLGGSCGGAADEDASPPAPCARWEEEKAATTTTTGGAHCYAYAYDGGDRLLTLQHLVVVPAVGRDDDDDDDDVTGAEVQASAIIRMARAVAGAQDSDRGASSRRRRSLGRFLQRRRQVRTHQEGAQRRLQSSSPPCLHATNSHQNLALQLLL